MQIIKRITFSAASVLLLSLSSVPVAALTEHSGETSGSGSTTPTTTTTVPHEETNHTPLHTETVRTSTTEHSGDVTTASETTEHSKGDNKMKLEATKLKVCQKHETNINNTFVRISERGQKQLTLFTTIAERTEKFYVTKGKTLSNYDALVADVNAKKAAAQTAVDTIKSESVTFKCDGTDPKGAATSFKTDLKTEINALKEYRTAVKNLIVGVKSVQSTTEGSN